MRVSQKIGFGTHMPILIRLFNMTDGSVLELGMGIHSTSYLHWACFLSKRRLVSFDSDQDYYAVNRQYRNDYHEVYLVKDWDSVDLSGPWSVALVDHESARRMPEMTRLANCADYVIFHDSEPRNDKDYRSSQAAPLYKYRFDFTDVYPHTSVFSNFKDLTNLI